MSVFLNARLFKLLDAETHVLKPPAQKTHLVRFKKKLFVKSCILSLWLQKGAQEVHNQKVHAHFINIIVEAVLNYQIAHCVAMLQNKHYKYNNLSLKHL